MTTPKSSKWHPINLTATKKLPTATLEIELRLPYFNLSKNSSTKKLELLKLASNYFKIVIKKMSKLFHSFQFLIK